MLKICLSPPVHTQTFPIKVLWLALLLPFCTLSQAASSDLVEQGRRIYLEGILSSGKVLVGTRSNNVKIEGAQAACVNCHRRSGMGSVEGDIMIVPITGNYLFNPEKTQVATMDLRSGKQFSQSHPAYNDESLAVAISAGTNNSGRKMLEMMPHFALEPGDMSAITAYLKQLSTDWSPGVTKDTIRLATVITPDVDPDRRKVFIDTLQKIVLQKNASSSTGPNKRGRRHMIAAAEMVMGTERTWILDVWELKGTPETWTAQLSEKYKSQPVFALLSGLSNTTWEPVHNFCENTHVPCWFASVPMPITTESFYSLYFSRGVILEADVLASYLADNTKPKRLIQIRRDDSAATEGAKRLNDALLKSGIAVEERIVKANEPASLQQALTKLSAEDTVVFWLRRDDLAELGKIKPLTLKASYFSTELAGGEQGIPASWQNTAHLIYPYEMPDKRQSNLTNFHTWISMKKMPLIDEPLQAQAFFAMEFLTETVSEMLGNFYQDYLLERGESMLSRSESIKSEQQVRERQMVGRTGAVTQQRGTSIYPHLGLGIGQRFASKGAYIVHFKDGKLAPESDWIVP